METLYPVPYEQDDDTDSFKDFSIITEPTESIINTSRRLVR